MAGEVRGPARSSRLTGGEWLLLLVLATIQFTHLVDFVIVMPLGPQFLRVLHITPQEFGVVVSAYGFSASLAGLLAAGFVDRFDRKRSLLVLYAGFALGTLLCAVVTDYWLLVMARAVAGGFGGVVASTLLAVVGDAFAYERRGTAMGVVMSGFSVAMIVGVPAGLYLAGALGWRAPFAVLGGLSLLVLAAAWWALPPLRGHLQAPGPREGPGLVRILLEPNHLRAYALMVALVLGVFMLVPYLATYLVANVGLSELELSYVYLCGGLATLGTVTLFGRLADRYGKLGVFRLTALSTVVPILLLTNLPAVPVAAAIAVTTLFMVLTSGRMVPAQAMITAAAAPQQRGSFLSVTASVQQLAAGLASILGGVILGTPGMGGEGPGALSGAPLEPIRGFGVVGLLSVGFTVLSVALAGLLRPAEGGLGAVDMPTAAPVPAAATEGQSTSRAAG